jgi:hypothetical protein
LGNQRSAAGKWQLPVLLVGQNNYSPQPAPQGMRKPRLFEKLVATSGKRQATSWKNRRGQVLFKSGDQNIGRSGDRVIR